MPQEDNILQELQQYEAPTKVPPVGNKAIALYEAAGFKVTDEVIAALRVELGKYAGDLGVLTDNIIGLGSFALYIRDERNDPAGAERLVRLIGEHAPKYFPIGERIVSALQDSAFKAIDIFDQFSGIAAELKKRAPKFGAAPPPDTVSLKRLKPMHAPLPQPKRPPPKKK